MSDVADQIDASEGAKAGPPRDPEESYFGHVRTEIGRFLPRTAERVLDVGCGAGATLAWVKTRLPAAETVGVEGFADNLPALSRNADRAIIADLNDPLPEIGMFDVIMALDVLEHLYDPDRLVKQLVDRLSPGGIVIISVPNIAHWSISLPLLFRQRFDYSEAGLMDRTHIRWFTEASARRLMTDAGLTITEGLISGFWDRRSKIIDRLTLKRASALTANQFIMKGERGGTGFSRWTRV